MNSALQNCEFCNSPAHVWFNCTKKPDGWKPDRLKKSTAARSNAKEMVVRTCEVCGKVFEVRAFEVKRGKGRTCSKACAAKLAARPDQTGSSNPNWKGGVPATEKNRRYVERHPEKHAAHLALTAAIRRGELVRKPCEVCGDPKTEGHHDDYSKPLDVRWLCKAHHLAVHRFMAQAGTQAPPVDTLKKAETAAAHLAPKKRGRPKGKTDRKAYQRDLMRKRRAKP